VTDQEALENPQILTWQDQQPSRPNELQVLIVAYGGVDGLRLCLQRLGELYPTVVVDNSSSDLVRELVEDHRAFYIDPGANLGFAGGVNLGIRHIDNPYSDVLLLNPDATIAPEAIESLRSMLKRFPEVASVAPLQTAPNTAVRDRVTWPFPTPASSWAEALGFGQLTRRCGFAIGSVLLLRGTALADVGGLDERFFMYAEETDWQWRAYKRGWGATYCPEAVATHVGAGTDSDTLRRELRFYSSAERYIRKHFGLVGWYSYRLANLCGSTIRIVVLTGPGRRAARQRLRLYAMGPDRAAQKAGVISPTHSRTAFAGEKASMGEPRNRAPASKPRVLIDARDLGINRKGVGRVLAEVIPRLVSLDPSRYCVVTTHRGLPLLDRVDPGQIVSLPICPQTAWEQLVLPGLGAVLGARAIYSHRECGSLWGPSLLLHLTEDPEVRWTRETSKTLRESARRWYSRAFMNPSLRRAQVVASTRDTAERVAGAHGLAKHVTVVPLGVDHGRFRPEARGSGKEGDERPAFYFYLGSSDPRDQVELVVAAFAEMLERVGGEGRSEITLCIGGDLGDRRSRVAEIADGYGIADTISILGRVADDHLARLYAEAVATVDASTDEGFGLQPLEALACGSLLISFGSAAVREVTAGAEVIWTAADRKELSVAMESALRDPHRRTRAQSKNPGVAARYSWETTAASLHEILVELAEHGQT
jgi:GT2 family glycosyltransferase/glycosyltransferase involved in cell wall biosynthesis